MRGGERAALLAALVSVAVCARGQAPVETPAFGVELLKVELASAGMDSVELDIYVEAKAARDTRIQSFSFHRFRANGLPAYIAPALERVELPANTAVRLGPFRAKLFFRDMSSLEPLRLLVQQTEVRIEGSTRVEIELGWMERLALWSRRAVIWNAFDRSLEVGIPGGALRELSAKALFALAEPIMRAGLNLRRARDAWFDDTLEQATGRVAAVRSTYSLRRPAGEPTVVESLATGLMVAPGRVLVPREALEPWRYDAATAFALDRGEIELAGEPEIELRLAGPQPEVFRMSRSELRVDAGKCDTERVLLLDENGKARRVRVCNSSGDRALATLEIVTPVLQAFRPWATVSFVADRPVELAVMRLLRGTEPEWEIVRLQGALVDGEIRLTEPIDRSALGSPMLFDGAPVGIAQHEYGGALLPNAP